MNLQLVLIAEEYTFSDHLGLVVDRNWHQGEIFGHLGFIFYPIDTARAGIDELFHSTAHRTINQLLASQDIDFPRQRWVQFNSGIISNVRQV